MSTTEQGTNGHGLDAQRAAIASACEQRGWELVDVMEDIASGKRTNGGLTRAMDAMDRGVADALIVAKVDRIARSTLGFADVMARAEAGGWRLVVLSPDLDLGSPHGRAMAGMLAVFAQLEREMISERTREGLAAAMAKGSKPGPKARISAEANALIVQLRREGRSYRAIAAALTEAGIPTAQGGRWQGETVRLAYLGTL